MKDIFYFIFFSLLPQLSNSYSRKPKDQKTLALLDASYVFHNNVPIRNFKTFINFANKKLMKEYETDEWMKRVDVTPKLEIYSFYKRHYEKESYCEVMLKRWQ